MSLDTIATSLRCARASVIGVALAGPGLAQGLLADGEKTRWMIDRCVNVIAMASMHDDIPRVRRLSLLGGGIFGVLHPRSLRQLAATGHLLHLERGASLFLKGDDGDAAFILLEGELEVRAVSKEGRELRITALNSGELIGEMAVLDGGPRSADVIASRNCRLWRLPRAAVLAALRVNAEAALKLLAELSRRLRAANTALELASRRTLEGQLAALLIAEKNRLGFVALDPQK